MSVQTFKATTTQQTDAQQIANWWFIKEKTRSTSVCLHYSTIIYKTASLNIFQIFKHALELLDLNLQMKGLKVETTTTTKITAPLVPSDNANEPCCSKEFLNNNNNNNTTDLNLQMKGLKVETTTTKITAPLVPSDNDNKPCCSKEFLNNNNNNSVGDAASGGGANVEKETTQPTKQLKKKKSHKKHHWLVSRLLFNCRPWFNDVRTAVAIVSPFHWDSLEILFYLRWKSESWILRMDPL